MDQAFRSARPFFIPFVIAIAGIIATAASAATETVTYSAGTPGTEFHAQFAWTVTNVSAKGTFADGSPWVKVSAGAQLIAVSPMSEARATSGGFLVTVNGSVKNPRMQYSVNPQTLDVYQSGKQLFDARRIFLDGPATQAALDATFDFPSNIGKPNPTTGVIAPVSLVAGDVVVTASSQWIEEASGEWTAGGRLPHTGPYRRTAINRFGVLTVLATAPTTTCFRPPLQWKLGYETTRPAPIPVSSVLSNESALLQTASGTPAGARLLLSGPTFHDGHGIFYQNGHAQHALSEDPALQGSIVYGGNLAVQVLRDVLFAATDATAPASSRIAARNRLIQYGIDCWGAAAALGSTRAGAGQRAAEMKPWIMLAGWWLNREEMRNPYQGIRNLYPGTSVASLSDTALGRLLFHDDVVAQQVVAGLGLGSPYHQRWGPGLEHQVTAASIAGSARLMDCGEISGQFGRLDLSGAKPHPYDHARDPDTYFGCSLRIEGGAGAGGTVYRVVEVGDVNGGFGDFIKVDRPWQHGTPDSTSTVRMFPFQNGDFTPDLTGDLGRWYYSTNGQKSLQPVDCLSPVANGYARVSYKALLVPYAALKRLAAGTGNTSYLRGPTWNLLCESIGGTGQSLVNGERFGALVDGDRITNQIWSRYPQSGLLGGELAAVKSWLGHDGTPAGFGFIDRSRLPGADPNGDGGVLHPCDQAMDLEDGIWTVATGPAESLATSAACVLHSVAWFAYRPVESGIVTVDTLVGAEFNTRLAVVSDCDASILYACNDDAAGATGGASAVSFAAVAGTRYLIGLGSNDPNAFGTAVLTVAGPASAGDPDPGDDFGYGEELGYLPCETSQRIVPGIYDIQIEPGLDWETYPSCLDSGGTFNQVFNPVLFRFQAERPGRYVASTCDGTLADTRIVVAAGCDSGIVVACNDDADGCWGRSEVVFDAEPGVEYVIIVGSKTAEDAGWGMLNLHEIPMPQDPRRMYMTVGIAGIAYPGGSLTGIKPHDIILLDQNTGAWTMHVDGSDVGLGSTWVIDALEALPDGSFVVSFTTSVYVPGLVGGPNGTLVTRSDLVRFIPTSVGWDTAGTWEFWFDGSDVGLTTTAEDIDAVDVLADGSVLISTKGAMTVPGYTNIAPQSILRFSPASLGSVTVGTWSWYFDSRDVGLLATSENVDAISVRPDGSVTLSTSGAFAVTGVGGTGGDAFDFFPDALGSFTAGWFNLWFDASASGFGASQSLNSLAEAP